MGFYGVILNYMNVIIIIIIIIIWMKIVNVIEILHTSSLSCNKTSFFVLVYAIADCTSGH